MIAIIIFLVVISIWISIRKGRPVIGLLGLVLPPIAVISAVLPARDQARSPSKKAE